MYTLSIVGECGRGYIGETGRPLVVGLREHRKNLEGHLETSIVVQHVFGVNHHIVWKEAKHLETQKHSVHRNHNEVPYVQYLKNSII
jgi:hypothetical protein